MIQLIISSSFNQIQVMLMGQVDSANKFGQSRWHFKMINCNPKLNLNTNTIRITLNLKEIQMKSYRNQWIQIRRNQLKELLLIIFRIWNNQKIRVSPHFLIANKSANNMDYKGRWFVLLLVVRMDGYVINVNMIVSI